MIILNTGLINFHCFRRFLGPSISLALYLGQHDLTGLKGNRNLHDQLMPKNGQCPGHFITLPAESEELKRIDVLTRLLVFLHTLI